MSERPIPHPDVELLKKRAKQLLRALRRAEPAALDRLRARAPRLARRASAELRLADAQLLVAREEGARSWPDLLRRLADAEPPARRAARLRAALREGAARAVQRLADRAAELAAVDPFAAAALGDVERVAATLAARPAFAAERDDPEGWSALLYAAASPLHRGDPARGRGLVEVARLLLEAGADPNDFTLWRAEDPRSRLPALYRACVAGHAELVDLLLARGARPLDGESIYHAAELDHRACLAALARHGADFSAAQEPYGNTPLYFLAGYREGSDACARATSGMRWLLAHGADPDVPSMPSLETPLHRVAAFGRAVGLAESLLDHGATVDRPRADGKTALALAVRNGNFPVAELLERRGADRARLSPVDELLGRCTRADGAGARAIVAAHPGLLGELTDDDRGSFARAAERADPGSVASLRTFVEIGFDPAWEGPEAGTPLHRAAWRGLPENCRWLVSVGAPIDARDREFGSSPIGWAAHGSRHCRRADDDYAAVVEVLLAAGAERSASFNRWGEPPESMASRGIAALLRQRGFAPPRGRPQSRPGEVDARRSSSRAG